MALGGPFGVQPVYAGPLRGGTMLPQGPNTSGRTHMRGYEDYGPFVGPQYSTAPSI